jgi:hypothetical protein
MTCGPRTTISPILPGGRGTEPTSMSTMAASVSGKGRPMEPFLLFPRKGLRCVMGAASVSPKPSTMLAPLLRLLNFSMTGTGMGAEPDTQ